MAFEIFTETRSRSAEFISVNETKAFGFPRAFLDANGITKDHKAVIMYDDEQKKIALQFVQGDTKFGFSVQIGNDKHGAIVKAKSFFEKKKLDAAKYARRYHDFEKVKVKELGLEGDGDAFVIQLKDDSTGKQEVMRSAEGGSGRQSTDVFPRGN